MSFRGIVSPVRCFGIACVLSCASLLPSALHAQQGTQPIDQEYTDRIKEYLTDSRISTELVNYMPASSTVPTPL